MRLPRVRFSIWGLMLALALVGVALAFLRLVVDCVDTPLLGLGPHREAAWAPFLFASRVSVCAAVFLGLMILRKRLRNRETDFDGGPTGRAWNKTTPLDAGIFLAGFALGLGCVFITAEAGQPYSRESLLLDRIGGVAVYGMSIGFLAILAAQCGVRGRRECLWTGEWLGVMTAAVVLTTACLESLALWAFTAPEIALG